MVICMEKLKKLRLIEAYKGYKQKENLLHIKRNYTLLGTYFNKSKIKFNKKKRIDKTIKAKKPLIKKELFRLLLSC